MSEDKVAVWSVRHGNSEVDIDNEEDGAYSAALDYIRGDAQPLGVQYPDGRTLRRGEWPAFAAAVREIEAEEREEQEEAEAARRKVLLVENPFMSGSYATVVEGGPAWVGWKKER